MNKSKLTKTITLGICFATLSSSIALANGEPVLLPSKLPAKQIQAEYIQPVEANILPAYGPDTPVSSTAVQDIAVAKPALESDVRLISADASEPAFEYENQLIRKDNVVRVKVNGEFLQLDVDPFIENNRTLIPLRGVMESLGAEVKWNQEEQKVEVYTEDVTIELVIGEDTASK
ncbi:copper amine oxidase N-terminal domain-containing protein [Clostridium sporogenes]|jgi:hypothetical protein|uniref:copper amine oxidase N-terminal domain-containing protein n=1 Tax=Clostridium TaxID=1485 RepID=UPI002149C9C3|nr:MULTISPECIES: copper amine oxidase N-terminal domain-containing protein [Clostridium]MBE6043173.1 copper amine oxidase N-terminal domain-containing protein [Clostridium thermopalmarium]MBE6065685.1 copper amine oxidase N-terminal domain-containing protein [Clostridium cochlearium]MCR1971841.1 copper amine oxidase N-terminal domain-containing protein [Clostridium cochlearium]